MIYCDFRLATICFEFEISKLVVLSLTNASKFSKQVSYLASSGNE